MKWKGLNVVKEVKLNECQHKHGVSNQCWVFEEVVPKNCLFRRRNGTSLERWKTHILQLSVAPLTGSDGPEETLLSIFCLYSWRF